DIIDAFNNANESEWRPNIHNPFFHLKTNGFWHLDPPKLQSKSPAKTPSVSQLRNANASAKLDELLFILLVVPEYREILRETIINTYFSNLRYDVQRIIEEQRLIRSQEIEENTEGYSESLIAAAEHRFLSHREVESIQVETPIRSAGFRRAIMNIYEYTCAVCELNIRTANGESMTDAAHIIPFSLSYNDDVRNGISLCKSHHWAFDTGLISLSDEYQVIVSPSIYEQGPTRWMLTELRDKLIRRPEEEQHYPAQEALAWHRERVLRQ
ncbi:hypothetical protein F4X90_06150, partial [Candidatus Poribacteria bacterium]|nr:hypothetical protein [Candidatus Poribacteria bacterium]